MKTKIGILGFVFFCMLLSCENDDDSTQNTPQVFTFDFAEGTEGWIGDFAEYPAGEEEFYDLTFSHEPLPHPLNESQNALMLSGKNHSDDLFMFVKKEISGLTPNHEYTLSFRIEFATDVASNQFGIGGSPGESVYIKAGATAHNPEKDVDEEGWYQLNIDKNNQSQSGRDMIVIGDFSNGTDDNIYTLKTLTNNTPFRATTNSNGSLWILTGTDSGFEGRTTIYFNQIEVSLQ